MKKCPNCQQIFSDDNQFCLNDGTPLSDVSDTRPSAAFFQTPDSAPTQIFSLPQPNAAKPDSDASKWLYLIIGVMATALVGLGLAFFLSRHSADMEAATIEPSVKSAETVSNANQSNVENESNELPMTNESNSAAFAPRPMPSINPSLNLTGRWSGDWTSNKAYFTAAMNLNDNGGIITGEIYWTLHRHTNPKKSGKSGATATEYVQGTFNPSSRTLTLSGYRKDDPQNIVVLDRYSLVLTENSLSLGGGSKSNGRFSLSR